jgi:chromosome segregation ATPase
MNNKAEAMIAEIKALSWWQRWFTDEKANIYKRFAEEAHAEILADTETKLNKYLRKLDNGNQDQKKKAALLRGVKAHLEAHNLSLTFDNMLDYVSGRVIGLEQELGDVRTDLDAANNKINQLENDLEQVRDQAERDKLSLQSQIEELRTFMRGCGMLEGIPNPQEGESHAAHVTGEGIPPADVKGNRAVAGEYIKHKQENAAGEERGVN